MALMIDPPNAPGHGITWSHLASDTSYAELHAFARTIGVPERGFDGDHYDIPAHRYDDVVAAGAEAVSSRELLARVSAAGLRSRKATRLRPRKPGRRLLAPPLLEPGDLVEVVMPAGPVDDARMADGVAVLESWGLRVRASQPPAGEVAWLAGPDDYRAERFTRAWLDPEVAAIWTGRGGFGSQRILDQLDWRILTQAPPTWLIGFSDITALHQALASRLGVVTAHACGVAGLSDPSAADSARELLMNGTVKPLAGRPGASISQVSGVLVGGNLTMLAAGAGTGFSHPATDSIVVLEDVGERPFRLDRVLTQVIGSGWLEGARGIVCGQFTQCGDPAEIAHLLALRLEPLGLPILYDVQIGHEPGSRALPLGAPATLDTGQGVLEVDPLGR
jgi:muramoyltetrapeptide carboxypeptidase